MTKLYPLFSALLIMISFAGFSQKQEKPHGHVFGTIYFDAFTETGKTYNATAMEIKRAYFGYKYHYNDQLTAYVKLDIGSPYDLSVPHRYAYFKNAGLRYHKDKLTLNVGIIDVLMFTVQEKFWGRRYIYKSFMDEYHFGPKADIGVNVSYSFIPEKLSFDLGFYNGEGYKNLQTDNSYRTGLGMTFLPLKGLTTRFYFDFESNLVTHTTLGTFVGYKWKKRASLGLEYNYQKFYTFANRGNQYGFSAYTTLYLGKKWEIFGRYDLLQLNVLSGENSHWNQTKGGSAVIAGIQYQLHKKIKMALDYQNWVTGSSGLSDLHRIFVHIEIKF